MRDLGGGARGCVFQVNAAGHLVSLSLVSHLLLNLILPVEVDQDTCVKREVSTGHAQQEVISQNHFLFKPQLIGDAEKPVRIQDTH